jgi:hypothetical protein
VSYAGPAAAIWVGLGIIYLIVLSVMRPQRIDDVARVHLDEEPAAVPAQRGEVAGVEEPA